MPLSVSSAMQAHLDGELQTLASLWTMTRRDGVAYYLTDHDVDITFEGNVYQTGIGYDRSAIEDKLELSVDNMEVKGILDGLTLTREDVRGGLLDGARITIDIVNYKDLSMGSVRRRTGWLGTVKQNNLGQFDAELRGLTQALSEGISLVYTPACPVDLGSRRCGIPITTQQTRANETLYAVGQWIEVPGATDVIWKCTQRGTTAASAPAEYSTSSAGVLVTDGGAIFRSELRLDQGGTVGEGGNRKAFNVDISTPKLTEFPTWFNNGAVLFTSGNNAGVSRGIKTAVEGTGGGLDIELHLRMPFNVDGGETVTLIPGCDKTITDCGNKFDNVLNFQGHPYIPGDNYLKTYPNSK